jgi:hypothetical protein
MIWHWLAAGIGEVNDRKAPVCKADRISDKRAISIRPPVGEGGRHSVEEIRIDRLAILSVLTCYPAH